MSLASRVDTKVVLLGREYAGKTCLIIRFINDTYCGAKEPYRATIGAAFGAKKVEVNGEVVELGIWDTAGSERYEAMSRIYYRGAKAAIICYDLTDRDSWTRTKFWVNELKMNEPECKIYLCGTKKDLVSGENKRNRQVDYHDTTDYAGEIGAEVFETSSKTGENIRELFLKITADYLADPATKREKEKKNLRLQEDTKKGGCCS